MTSWWGRLFGTAGGTAAGGILIEFFALTNPIVGATAAVCGGLTGYYGGSHIDQMNDEKKFNDKVKQEVETAKQILETKMNKERQEAIQQRNKEREEERRRTEQSKKQLINAKAEIEKMKSLQNDLQEEKLQREKLIEEKLKQEEKMNSRIEQMDAVMKSLQTNLEQEKLQQEKLIEEKKKQEEKMNSEMKQKNEVVKSLQKKLEEEKCQQEKLIQEKFEQEEKMNSEIVKLRMKLNNEPYESHPLPEYLNQHKSDNIDALNFQVIVKRLIQGNFQQNNNYYEQ